MKKQLSLMLILAGVGAVSVANAQFTVDGPYDNTDPQMSTTFGDLVNAMKNANQSSGQPLYVPTDYTSFLFEWDGSNVNSGVITTNPAGPIADGMSGTSLLFKEGANRLLLQMNGNVDVGFIDNESVDRNQFGVYGIGDDLLTIEQNETIFSYNGQGATQDPPPAIATLIPDEGSTPQWITFWQYNGFTDSRDPQSDPVRFRTFYAADKSGETQIDYILFRIADRNIIDDNDYDDGFFLVAGPNLVPVPEPSTIGLLSVAGLVGLVLIRRRFTARKKADKAA